MDSHQQQNAYLCLQQKAQLLLDIRDARSTDNAQRELLYALALRSNPNENYSCSATYKQLERDTLLGNKTLRRAANKLVADNLISRAYRTNDSNIFFIN